MLNMPTWRGTRDSLPLLYFGGAFLCVLLVYVECQQGLYSLALSSALLVPLCLFCGMYALIQDEPIRDFWGNYVLVTVTILVVTYQLLNSDAAVVQLGVYLTPLAAYTCLPLRRVPMVSGLFVGLVFLATAINVGMVSALEQTLLLSLFLWLSWQVLGVFLSRIDRLKHLSVKDTDSGAYNRRHFQNVLAREVERGQNQQHGISLIGVRLDDLDQIADLYGKQSVRQFLPQFVEYMRQQIRTGDDIFRFNDGLFVLLLTNCSEDGTVIFMERIKRCFTDWSVPPFSEVALSVASIAYQSPDSAVLVEERLLKKMKKQKRAVLHLSAFATDETD